MFSTRRCVLHGAFVAAILSCGRGEDSGARTEQGNGFRVALLTPGPVSDQSWNAGAYADLVRIRDSLSAHVSHIQTRTPAEFEENFRQYAARGFALVFQNADAAGLGVFQTARERRRALVFGSNAEHNSVAPDVIIGSVVIDLPHAFLTVARAVKEGEFKPVVLGEFRVPVGDSTPGRRP